MPSILDSKPVTTGFSNLFVSPFGNDGVIPLYSSIPIPNLPSGTCLPCVVCGNSQSRVDVLNNSLALASQTVYSQPYSSVLTVSQ